MARKYYEAYDDRYKIVHAKGVSWLSDQSSPIVLNTIKNIDWIKRIQFLTLAAAKGEMRRLY